MPLNKVNQTKFASKIFTKSSSLTQFIYNTLLIPSSWIVILETRCVWRFEYIKWDSVMLFHKSNLCIQIF